MQDIINLMNCNSAKEDIVTEEELNAGQWVIASNDQIHSSPKPRQKLIITGEEIEIASPSDSENYSSLDEIEIINEMEVTDEENVVKEEVVCSNDQVVVEPNEMTPTTEENIVNLMRDKPEGLIGKLTHEIFNLPNVNVFRKWQNTYCNLFFHASWLDCPQAIQPLLENGGDPTLTNNTGVSVLHLLAKRGQLDMAKRCFSAVSPNKRLSFINAATSDGWTPLMSAAEENQLDFVKWLLSKNALVNFTMRTGWTAMHAAAKNNNSEVLKLMLKKGGDKNIQADHRMFGWNVKVEQVTTDEQTLKILKQLH